MEGRRLAEIIPEALRGLELSFLIRMGCSHLDHTLGQDETASPVNADSGGARDSGKWGGWEAGLLSFQMTSICDMVCVLPIKKQTKKPEL